MAAPTVAAVGTTAAGTTTCTPTIPSGVVNGSLVILFGVNLSGTGTLTAPAGFAEIVSYTAATPALKAWWKRATGSESGTYTVTGALTNNVGGFCMRISGDNGTSSPFGAITDNDRVGSSSTGPSVDLSSVVADSLLVHSMGVLVSKVFTPSSGFTLQSTTSSARLMAATKTQATTGSSGTVNGTIPTATDISAVLFSILPAVQTVTMSGIDSSAALGSPTVTAGSVTVSPGGIDSTASVGTPTVTPGSVTVSPSGVDSSATLGTPTVTPGPVTVSPSGIDSSAAVGTPTVVPGSVTVSPGGIDSTVLLGAPSVTPGAVTIEPAGIDSSAELGTPTVTAGGFTVTPPGIDSSALLGTPSILLQPVVAGIVRDHETGTPVGAGVVVKLFDDNDLLVDTAVTASDGSYIFYRPIGDTDLYWTLATYTVSGVQYHGVSDRGCPAV